MIIEFYPNPNPIYVKPVAVLPPPPAAPLPVRSLTPQGEHGGMNGFNVYQADKRSITVEEFLRRDTIIRDVAKLVNYQTGEIMFPYTKEEFDKKGKCRIIRIMRTYAEFPKDHVWKDGNQYIVEATAANNNFAIFQATPGFFVKEEPK